MLEKLSGVLNNLGKDAFVLGELSQHLGPFNYLINYSRTVTERGNLNLQN